MSEQDLLVAIDTIIEKRVNYSRARGSDKQQHILSFFVALLAAAVMWGGKTLNENQISIAEIQTTLERSMGDRFTGVEGANLSLDVEHVTGRVTIAEEDIQALEHHDTIDTMQHLAIDTHHTESHSVIGHRHKNYIVKDGHED